MPTIFGVEFFLTCQFLVVGSEDSNLYVSDESLSIGTGNVIILKLTSNLL